MKYTYSNNFIYIYIITFFYLLLFIKNINAEKQVIDILIKKPDIEDPQYLINYNTIINNFFLSKNNNITDAIDFEIKFSYCTYTLPQDELEDPFLTTARSFDPLFHDTEYGDFMKCVVQKVKNKEYDMMILDDKVLYSDSANLRNFALDLKFNFFEDIKSYFIDFNKYISTNDLNFHDKNIIKDGSFNENEMYGLPYEFDFDVLYYHKNNSDYKNFLSEKIISDIKIDTNVILNSNETLELNKTDDDDNNKLSIALGEYDELLNFYIEYVAYHYGIPKTDDPVYFNIFYKNNPKNLYQSFRNYLISSAGADLNKVLKVKMQDAYNSFINDKKKLYKGKASQYKFLKNKNDTLIQSLPNNYSVVNEKYLVINNGTSKDISFLTNIAFQLTSRDIQIYRAQNMGTIPTFDMSQAPTDQYINSYCQTEPEICELIKNLNGIQIKDMFKKDEYSASFFESRILIPVALRKFVYENDDTDLIQAYKINLEINSVKAPRYFVKHMFYIYGIISFFMVAMMLVIILVHKNRKHPYIKQISPNLSNLIILGMIIDIGLPMYYDIMYVVNIDGKIYQMSYFIIDSITRNLMFLPMFSIVYRIYYIYNNRYKINFGNKLKERRFIIYVIIILCLEVTCWVFYSIYTKKVYSSNGDLISTRDIDYYLDYAFSVLFHTIYVYVYYFVIVS